MLCLSFTYPDWDLITENCGPYDLMYLAPTYWVVNPNDKSDQEEVDKFAKMAEDWWNLNGVCKPLHSMNRRVALCTYEYTQYIYY